MRKSLVSLLSLFCQIVDFLYFPKKSLCIYHVYHIQRCSVLAATRSTRTLIFQTCLERSESTTALSSSMLTDSGVRRDWW